MKRNFYTFILSVFIISIFALILFFSCNQNPVDNEKDDENSSSSSSSLSSSSSSSSSSAEFDFFVDAVNGNNAYAGTTSSTAFKTITHAVSTAGANKKIKVQPGLYNTANGETFPITLLEGQQLTGDVANKGDGTIATEIRGSGLVPGTSNYAALICGENSVLEGLKLSDTSYQTLHYNVWIGEVSVNVSYNTFADPANSYAGIMISQNGSGKNIDIIDNSFNSFSYGIRIDTITGDIYIAGNGFSGTMDTPIDVISCSSATLIYNNSFSNSGLWAIMVENGYPVIQENLIIFPGGYSTYAAIYCQYSAYPKIRGNHFDCVNAIMIIAGTFYSADPDIGKDGDPGNNDFDDVSGYAVYKGDNNAAGYVFAIGNIWPNDPTPPTLGDEIFIEATGDRVVYGTGASDYVQK